jgi:putative membrane protein
MEAEAVPMIVRPRPGLFALLFAVRGSILPKVWRKIVLVAAVSATAVLVERQHPSWFPSAMGIGPFTLIGLALSIFLGFRNSASYDRWWEARRNLGSLIVEARNLSRVLPVVMPDQSSSRRCTRRVCAFAYALRARLRGGPAHMAAAPWLVVSEAVAIRDTPSPADAVLVLLTDEISHWRREGYIGDVAFSMLEQKIGNLAAIQAACERIHSTPLPYAYTLLFQRTAWLYCLSLPFALAPSVGWATPIADTIIAYTFFGLDALTCEIEEPFGTEANDLPLDALVAVVEGTVQAATGESLPSAPVARNYLLT